MNDEQLAKLKALCAAAAPAPWQSNVAGIEGDNYIAGTGPWYRLGLKGRDPGADAEFIAAARSAVPELIAEVERLRDERQRVADTLGPAVAFVRDWQLCELRHMSDAPSARAACALERAFQALGAYQPEVTS